MKTLSFIDMCAGLNEYHHNLEYVIAFKANNFNYLIKYGDIFPHTYDEMQALIKMAKEEYKSIKYYFFTEGE